MRYHKITLSGKICTGKTTLLKLLEQRLRWPTFLTGQLFREYVFKKGLTLEKAQEQSEQLTKKIDYQVRDMIHKKGNLIVDGWMSGIMANNLPDVLRVLLVCDDWVRAKRFAHRENTTVTIALEKIRERNNNWVNKLKKIYCRGDFFHKKNYNLIIDTTHLSAKQVLNKVLRLLV